MTTVAVLGNGLLARSIFDVLVPMERSLGEPPQIVMLGHDDFDIRNYDSIVAALRAHKPDVIINTVAYHNVALCERNPDTAFDINSRGAERVASLCPTVYVSTDYVFSDGGPHDESMPGRQPRSVYGRSKLAGELATLEKDGIVVRVSGLYHHEYQSHKGPSFPESVLSGWDAMELPTDQVFSPTYAPDAAERIVRLALDRVHGYVDEGVPCVGIYHAANAGSVSWADFAPEILSLAGRRRKVRGVVRHDPIRPTNSALRSTRLPPLRNWRVALDAWWLARQAVIDAKAISPLRENA